MLFSLHCGASFSVDAITIAVMMLGASVEHDVAGSHHMCKRWKTPGASLSDLVLSVNPATIPIILGHSKHAG